MANQKQQIRRYIDLSGGMNTYVSDSLILDNQSISLVNLVNDGNRIKVIPWYSKHTDGNKARGERYKKWVKNEIQWFAYNWDYMAFIIDRDLITYNVWTGASYLFPDVVGFNWKTNIISNQETYQITIWNDYFIVTNTLMNENSPLYHYWEPARIFWHYEWVDGEITNRIVDVKYNGEFCPRWSSVINGNIYFAGGRKWLDKISLWRWPAYSTRDSLTDDSMVVDMADFTKVKGTYRAFIWQGDSINAIIHNAWNIFIGKKDGIYIVQEQMKEEIEDIVTKPEKVTQSGIQNNFSWVNVNNQIFYYDGVSVRILSQEMQNSLTDQSISRNIQKELDCLPREQKWSAMNFEYPFVKLFLSTEKDWEYNDIAFVYNIETQSWSIQKDILMRYCDSAYEYRNARMNSFFTWVDGIIYQDNDGTTFGDEPIEFEWISKWFIFNQDPFQTYKITKSRLYWENDWEVDFEMSMITENIVENKVVLKETEPRKIKIYSHKEQTTGNSLIWTSTLGNFRWRECNDMKKYICMPCTDVTSWYKQFFVIRWSTFWEFNIEQLTFHIEQESQNKELFGKAVSYLDKI